MKTHDIQHAIIETIRRQAPAGQNLADVLAPILQLSKNAVYKRITGATALTLDELGRLSQYFQLPLQQLFYPEKHTFAAEFSGIASPTSVMEYLRFLENDLASLRQDPAAEVWHVTIGLPDFYIYHFEELTQFQVFTWERLVWNNPAWSNRRFNLDMPEKEDFLNLTKRQAHHFEQLPVTEIWNEYVLDNFFQQLIHVAQYRLYEKKEDINRLCEVSAALVVHLKEMSLQGKRYPPGGAPSGQTPHWHLLYNETMKNNIFFLVKTSAGVLVYSVLDNPNFIKTYDPKVVEHIRQVFDRLTSQSVPLDGQNGRFRELFFDKLEKRQQAFAQKILKML